MPYKRWTHETFFSSLFEVLGIDKLSGLEAFKDFSTDDSRMILAEAEKPDSICSTMKKDQTRCRTFMMPS